MINFRASALHEIMGNPKTGDGLSVSAKTALRKMAKEAMYGFNKVVTAKTMDKGIMCEQDAIDLYNMVFFSSHEKNTVRLSNEYVSGECDILVPSQKVIDIKNAWSLDTFPATNDEVQAIAKDSGYDWQGRAYMWLYDVPLFELAYCMVSTPDDLIRFEQPELHYVDHIAPELRVTRIFIERDKEAEDKIKHKVTLAREYLQEIAEQITADHQHEIFKKAA